MNKNIFIFLFCSSCVIIDYPTPDEGSGSSDSSSESFHSADFSDESSEGSSGSSQEPEVMPPNIFWTPCLTKDEMLYHRSCDEMCANLGYPCFDNGIKVNVLTAWMTQICESKPWSDDRQNFFHRDCREEIYQFDDTFARCLCEM